MRTFALALHVTSSVGWLGAVAVFLALAVIGSIGHDAATVRGAYLVMEPVARFVLVPLAFASLVTGLAQALGTAWGLFRHWWVVFKLVINVVATAVLLMYLETLSALTATAADPNAELEAVRDPSPLVHAGAAAVLLLVATALGVYKPHGMTWYGRRKQRRPRSR